MVADRVHPAAAPNAEEKTAAEVPAEPPAAASGPESPSSTKTFAEKPKPPPGTYVVQVPKDQIFRVPPPENARRFEAYTRRATRRRRGCCFCLAWTVALLLFLLFALAVAVGILYLVFQPKIPKYSVDGLAVKGFNLSSAAATNLVTLSPEFDATIRADNPNKKIGIYYRSGSSITASYDGVDLCHGVWPTFYQGKQNVTVFQTALTGSGIRLSAAMQNSLVTAQSRGEVPLDINIKVPVKIKFGAVTTWTITVKVGCDVTVDKLAANARIVSKSCSVKVDPF